MAGALYTNNASATLAAAIATTGATSLTVTSGQGALFPSVSGGSTYFYATIIDVTNNIEIVKVTSRSTDTFTIVRAQQGTTARTFAIGSKVELRITGTGMNEKFDVSGGAISGNVDITGALTITTDLAVAHGGTGASDAATARTNLGLGTLATASTVNNAQWSGTQLSVANGGTGATTAGAALTNLGAAASGANTDITALDQDVTITATGTIAANSIGYRGLPQSSNTTLALADAGKHLYVGTAITIPANSSVAFPVGTTIVLANSAATSITVSITTDTLRQAGTANTGTRNLLPYGLATLVKVATTTWMISGTVS